MFFEKKYISDLPSTFIIFLLLLMTSAPTKAMDSEKESASAGKPFCASPSLAFSSDTLPNSARLPNLGSSDAQPTVGGTPVSDFSQELPSDAALLAARMPASGESSEVIAHIPRPLEPQEKEEHLRRFLGGRLVFYRHWPSGSKQVELPIAKLANPLSSSFDLGKCCDAEKYLKISTGYRTALNPSNHHKLEVWVCPWFLFEQDVYTSAKHYNLIRGTWDPRAAPIGLFFNWGHWNEMENFDFTQESFEDLSARNLLGKNYDILGDSLSFKTLRGKWDSAEIFEGVTPKGRLPSIEYNPLYRAQGNPYRALALEFFFVFD